MAWQTILDIENRAAIARLSGPQDIFTKSARAILRVGSALLIVLVPVEFVTTGAGGCLIALTFGLFALILTVIWLPMWGLLMGSSWLWLKVPPLRPILLVPGVLLALIVDAYVTLAPESHDAKWAKLTLAGEWPLTWLIVFPLPGFYQERSELELTEREWDAMGPLLGDSYANRRVGDDPEEGS
jgi:hypothetical protein